MSEIKTDKRILHTKFFLKNALLELLKTKRIEQITTTELCKKANINRNTFYVHYSTPEELLDEIQNELLCEVRTILTNPSDQQKLHSLYQHFREKKEIYKIFIISENHSLSNKLRDLCKENNIYNWQILNTSDEKLSEMFFLYASSGSTALINKWIMDDCLMPIEELQYTIDTFSLHGLSFLQKK